MSQYKEDLAKMLRALRSSCSLTQNDVAKILGVNRVTYTCYETGKTSPSVETLLKLSRIFNIPPEAFFTPEDFSGNTKSRR